MKSIHNLRSGMSKKIGMGRLDRLIANLKESGLRVTEPRVALLNVFLEEHGPFTAEELHSRLLATCDLATVYRSLASLEEVQMIARCEFGDGMARYELKGEESHHHHHVVCRQCRKVEILDDCELQGINAFVEKKGFTSVTHSLEFFGICAECQLKTHSKSRPKTKGSP